MTTFSTTAPAQPATRARPVPWSPLRISAAAGYAGFVGLAAVATLLQPPSYDSFRDYVSGLAAVDAAHPWVMVAGFESGAIGFVAAAILLFRRLRGGAGRTGAVLVGVAGVALAVAGLARFDVSRNDAVSRARIEAGMSLHSQVHGLAALFVFLPMVVAAFLLAVAVWRGRSTLAARLGPAVLAVAVAQAALIVAVEENLAGQPGLLQRVVLLLTALPVVLAVASKRS